MIRTAEDVLRIVKERGMKVIIDPGPPVMPMLDDHHKVHKSLVSQTLLDALRAYRLEIIELLSKGPL